MKELYLRVGNGRAMLLHIYWLDQETPWFNEAVVERIVQALRHLIPTKLIREHLAKEKELADIYRDDRIQFAYYIQPSPIRHNILQHVDLGESYTYHGLQLHGSMLVVCAENLIEIESGTGTLDQWIQGPAPGYKRALKKPLDKPIMSGIKYGKNPTVTGPEDFSNE